MNPEQARQRSILYGYRGSVAHGTYLPKKNWYHSDDKDTMGVFIAPIEYYFGLKNIETIELKQGEEDAVYYELRKFVRLLLKGNPNVLMMLWLNDQHIIHLDDYGRMLIDNRDIFVSKKAYHAFSGYAYGQLKRMTHGSTEGYMGEKRKEIVARHGYDCKNASHLIRLLRMGVEFMNEGRLYVVRPDAPQLVSIKCGEWTLEQVQREAEKLFKLAEEAYVRSPLKNEPDSKRAEELVVEILSRNFGRTL